jgi:tetratricopeptide (TPR) repeat protein
MKPRISAAMIVRDEERYLDDCLKSIAAEVDEIVVVDTGSIDRTREIASAHGARIVERSWTGDFSAARNCAIDHASGDWILYIDADERLAVPAAGALRAAIDRPDAVALSVRFQPYASMTPYQEIRVFRRDGRIRFRGVIHETVHPDIREVMRSDGLILVPVDIGLNHIGYEGDLTPKHHRNLPLLEQATKADPERVFLWADMARSLTGLGRREDAESAAWHAVELATSTLDAKQRADGAMGWHCLISLFIESYPVRAADLAHRAIAAYPDHHALALARAKAIVATGGAEEALPILRNLTLIDANTFVDPLTAYDKRIFGEWAFDLLGAAYARLGRRDEAAGAFARAASLAPGNLGYRVKAAAFSARKS